MSGREREALRPAAERLPALGPERVPRVQVEEVLAAVDDSAVDDLEHDAAVDVELLPVTLGDGVVDADHVALLVAEQAFEVDLECPTCLLRVAPESGEDGVAADCVAGDRAGTGRVPGGMLVEELGERGGVRLVER